MIEELQGSNLSLLRSAAMLKPPRVGSEKKIHQDVTYYPIQPHNHVTVWIALDEATEANGCMQVVPGAHLDGLLGHDAMEYETDITINERETTNIQQLRGRVDSVTEGMLERLRDSGELTLGRFRTLVDVRVVCEDFNTQYNIARLIESIDETSDYLVVALLPEDAQALPDQHERITER